MQLPLFPINREMSIDAPINFTAKQVIGWVVAATLTLTTIAFAAGNYAAEFNQIKKDVAEGKEIAKELTHEIKLLREEMQKQNVTKH